MDLEIQISRLRGVYITFFGLLKPIVNAARAENTSHRAIVNEWMGIITLSNSVSVGFLVKAFA